MIDATYFIGVDFCSSAPAEPLLLSFFIYFSTSQSRANKHYEINLISEGLKYIVFLSAYIYTYHKMWCGDDVG